jgi:hypothetical protein
MTNRGFRGISACLAVLTLFLASFVGPVVAQDWPLRDTRERRPVDLVLCLDTSDSMKDLIQAAQVRLWSVVSLLATTDPLPDLRVALLTYGHKEYSAADGWVRIETELTGDLDLVYGRLSALETEGGLEYVARVIETALDSLEWSDDPAALRLILVAGNEPADQDPKVDYREIALEAGRRDVIVNPIFFGRLQDEAAESWKEIADLALGEFAVLDRKSARAFLASPVDAELVRLGEQLNDTYIPFGETGPAGRIQQAAQDEQARALDVAVAAGRSVAKASGLYSPSWDLIDALQSGRIDWESIDESMLPDEMKPMTWDERESYLRGMLEERERIREEIAEYSRRRWQHLSQRADRSGAGRGDFGGAIGDALRRQAQEKGFTFQQPEQDESE